MDMKFIKRIIFIIILLLIAFFVYRLISPTSAQALLTDIKTFSNDTLGTHFSLAGEAIIATGDMVESTGYVIEDDGALEEMTGDDELILKDTALSQTDSGIILTGADEPILTGAISSGSAESTGMVIPATPATTTRTTTKKSTTSSSSQENRAYQNIMQGFGN